MAELQDAVQDVAHLSDGGKDVMAGGVPCPALDGAFVWSADPCRPRGDGGGDETDDDDNDDDDDDDRGAARRPSHYSVVASRRRQWAGFASLSGASPYGQALAATYGANATECIRGDRANLTAETAAATAAPTSAPINGTFSYEDHPEGTYVVYARCCADARGEECNGPLPTPVPTSAPTLEAMKFFNATQPVEAPYRGRFFFVPLVYK